MGAAFLPSPACGRWAGERGFCFPRSMGIKAVSSRCRGPSYFSLRGQRKVAKREATPMARPPGILPCGCAGGSRGFPTALPCAVGKLAGHPADYPHPARRAIEAPGKAARSCAQKQQQQHPTPALPRTKGWEAAGLRRFAFAFASGAHDARLLFRAPSAAVSRGRQGRAAGVAMEGNVFSRGQEPTRKARQRLTDFPSMDGRKALPRGVVSSWLLLLDSGHPCPPPFGPASPFARAPARAWTSKGEVTRAAAAARNRPVACECEGKAPAPQTHLLAPQSRRHTWRFSAGPLAGEGSNRGASC